MVTADKVTTIAEFAYPAPVHLTAAKDATRPALTAVQIKGHGNTVTMAAADGFRMLLCILTVADAIEEPFERLVPAEFLAGFQKQVNKKQFNPQLKQLQVLSDGTVGYLHEVSHNLVTCDSIQATFPDVERIIPWQAAESQARPQEVAFNPKYLADMQKALGHKTADIVRWLPLSRSSAQMFIARSVNDDADLVYVVMPMHSEELTAEDIQGLNAKVSGGQADD